MDMFHLGEMNIVRKCGSQRVKKKIFTLCRGVGGDDHVHSSMIHNNQKMEPALISISFYREKQNTEDTYIYTHRGE